MKFNILTTHKNNQYRLNTTQREMRDHGVDYELQFGYKSLYGHDAHLENLQNLLIKNIDEPYIIACEDDLQFTREFTIPKFNEIIKEGERLKYHIVFTGANFVHCVTPNSDSNLIFNVKGIGGTHCMVIYKPIYDVILSLGADRPLSQNLLVFSQYIKKGLTAEILTQENNILPSIINAQHNPNIFSERGELTPYSD